MKTFKTLRQIIEAVILTMFPMLFICVADFFIGNSLPAKIFIYFMAYLVSAVAIFCFDKYIGNIKCFRRYKKYEGRWIEIIPGFSRNISICKIYFKDGEYHFDGCNYEPVAGEPVKFQSEKFIISKSNEFFYISESNQKHRPEGFGKVFSISNSDNGFYTANGYFFDVCSTGVQTIHNTKMIKFEEKFYDSCLNIKRSENPKKFSDREIYEHVKEYIENNFNLEVPV